MENRRCGRVEAVANVEPAWEQARQRQEQPVAKSRPYLIVAAVTALALAAGTAALWSEPRGGQGVPGARDTAASDQSNAAAAWPTPQAGPVERVVSSSPVNAGRYIIMTAGCNDCHTPGYMESGSKVPEELWLTGVPVGWRGPWGTTYASNLRLFVKDFDEDTFVQVVRARNTRPPMPWSSLHAMSDADLRAVYGYIKSLPIRGQRMPEYVPPGQEPATPYLVLEPVFPRGAAGG
ncbi:hypothetical protein [Fontivita pretiosa]|uniref:hypothetical protein n=1 Tax=Fontivita pretiosa TaxID=2989684 RepID=UPI003D1628E3